MPRSSITILLVTCLVPALACAQARLLEFRDAKVCNASAAVAINDHRVMVGDDEKPRLVVFDIAPPKFIETVTVGSGESDIEGATVLNGRAIWIASHGRTKKGKVDPERQKLFASHRIDDGRASSQPSVPFTGLLDAIQAKAAPGSGHDPAYAPLAKAIGGPADDPDLAPKLAGFNIEGLATTEGLVPSSRSPGLLVGLRNPVATDGLAFLFEILNPLAVVNQTDAAELGRVITIDLRGRRIRDIVYSAKARAYLIVGGPVGDHADLPKDGGRPFAIFRWNGDPAARPETTDTFADALTQDDFHPEVILALPERKDGRLVPSNRVLLLSDDGKRQIGGKPCEDLPAQDRFFRGVIAMIR